jgi:hypothetical protein
MVGKKKNNSSQKYSIMLTEDQIEEFQQIYKNQFNKEISKEEALEQGTKLITLMKILVDYQMKNQDKNAATGDKENHEESKSFCR